MTAQQQGGIRVTAKAGGTIAEKRFVTFGATGVTQAAAGGGAGVAIMGVADHAAVLNDALRVIVGPTAMVEAGEALDGSTLTLKTNADGRAIATTGGSDVIAARLMPGQTALASGDIIEVFLNN